MSKPVAVVCMAILSCTTVVAQPFEQRSFRATVVIEVVDRQGIAVFADTNHDRSIDERFFLQQENATVDAAMPLRLVSANVEYRPGYARIVAGNDVIELTVTDVPPPAWNPRGFRVWRQDGYGLSRSGGETSVPMPASDRHPGTISTNFCDASTSCYPGETGGGGGGGGAGAGTVTCDSGGPGSTSCSTTDGTATCSTTCGTGYYACCNNPTTTNRTASCKCIKG
jgi:hypothetical protein